ncbi:MAG: hypothetical protein MR388_04910, partial [Tenericutes bacterium]|nr:hypothetical protein [Mycoplasmatota bacterium]
TKITNNTNEITSIKSNIEELQNNLNNVKIQWKKIAETTSTDGINIDFNASDYSEILLVALRGNAFALASVVSPTELYSLESEGIVVEHGNVSVSQLKKISNTKGFLKVNKASTYSDRTILYAR